MKVLVANTDGDVKRGEILVPVRDPSSGLWLAGVSTGCESITGEVVDIRLTEQDIFAFQGSETATMDDINWLCKELLKYPVGTELSLNNGTLYVVSRTEHGNFWTFMVIISAAQTAIVALNPGGLQVMVMAVTWGCVMAYRHLR